MDITNKAKRPLSVPLPGGKKLFLGPGKTGQVTPKALAHPPLVKLIEAGDLETSDDTGGSSRPGSGGIGDGGGIPGGGSGNAGGTASGAMRQSGDR